MAVNDDDPCQRLAALKSAYYALISGQAETLVRYKGPEGEREVRYSSGNIERLSAAIALAETECAEAQGTLNRNRRFSIRGGSRRSPYFRNWR